MSWNKDNYTKEGFFYVGLKKDWEYILYRFYSKGLGDLIYNTLRKIIETKDKSVWAYDAFIMCEAWLIKDKRWTDSMQNENKQFIARNWFEQRYYILRFKKKLEKFMNSNVKDKMNNLPSYSIKYRPQKSITRDPFIAMRRCAAHLKIDQKDLPKMPFHLLWHTPNVRKWERAVLGKGEWTPPKENENKPEFVSDLDKLMKDTFDIINSN